MNHNRNSYQLHSAGQTTGWNPLQNDVNGKNTFNMTPAQVAVQAGDVDEFRQIVNDPHFQPEMMGPLGIFFTVCSEQTPDRYKTLKQFFDTEFRPRFKFDHERKVFVRIQ